MPAKKTKSGKKPESVGEKASPPKAKASQKALPQAAEPAVTPLDLDGMMTFVQANLDASLKASAILSEGARRVNDLMVEGMTTAVEESAAVAKAMMDCHSLPDLLELQNTLARSVVETALNESQKISEASLKTIEDAVEPLAERFAQAAESFGLPDAA